MRTKTEIESSRDRLISVCEAWIDNQVYWPSCGGNLETFQKVFDKMAKLPGQTDVIMLITKLEPEETLAVDCCSRRGYVTGMFIYSWEKDDILNELDLQRAWDCIESLEKSEEKEKSICNPEMWLIKL